MYLRIIFLFLIAIPAGCLPEGKKNKGPIPSPEKLHEMAVEESLEPVHPGIPGERTFWNVHAQRFIFAPAFDFRETENADTYKFSLVAEKTGEEFSFTSERPWHALSPVWAELPSGKTILTVFSHRGNEVIDTAGTREFFKAEPFSGPYSRPEKSYSTSVKELLSYLYNASYIQNWLIEGTPDPGYGLYGYPSKMFSAVIEGMLMMAEETTNPGKQDTSMQIAHIVADYLIGLSQPAGSPLEFFPPTYTGPIYADMLDEYRGESLADRIMLVYPTVAANAYLDLSERTSQDKYLDAAIRIADTYKKLQLDNGSWHLLMYIDSGEPVSDNYLVPTGVINLIDRLKNEQGITGYENCREKALKFIQRNLVKDYNWEGQFEDQKPSEKYKNLSKGQACSYALYLMENEPDNPDKIREAEELIHFAEDQFVIWDDPNPIDSWGIKGESWLTPCVLEQYNFYTPVNASSANMIQTYRKAHEITGNILYLAKAIELANNIVMVQKENGHYPTYLVRDLLDQEGWINCMVYTAEQVRELDEYVRELGI